MCGRYADFLQQQDLEDAFAIAESADDARLLPPSWNIAPTQAARILTPVDGGLRVEAARWGLVPGWAKDPSVGSRMFNARSETAAEKPSFRAAYKRRRCLVPASGYYEWETLPGGKQPYFITAEDGSPLAFAGLYELWGPQGEPPLVTFSILTRAARGELARIHDREPIMLPADAREAWTAHDAGEAELEAALAADSPAAVMTQRRQGRGERAQQRPRAGGACAGVRPSRDPYLQLSTLVTAQHPAPRTGRAGQAAPALAAAPPDRTPRWWPAGCAARAAGTPA